MQHQGKMHGEIRIRDYRQGEESLLWEIYHGAIHHVCSNDYSQQQINAWAPDEFDSSDWVEACARLQPIVAVADAALSGYSDLQENGLIDHFFVHHQHQRKGVATALMNEIHTRANARGVSRLHSHVSITAQPFYERFGFKVVSYDQPVIRGVTLSNATMEKWL